MSAKVNEEEEEEPNKKNEKKNFHSKNKFIALTTFINNFQSAYRSLYTTYREIWIWLLDSHSYIFRSIYRSECVCVCDMDCLFD